MPPAEFHNYYKDLGLEHSATPDAIKAAFRALAIQHHPDKTGVNDSDVFRAAREAYEKLTNASFKAKYDGTYWSKRPEPKAENADNPLPSPPKQYEAPPTQRYGAGTGPRAKSPPPKKPARKPGEPGWKYFNGLAYKAWQERYGAYIARHPEMAPEWPQAEQSSQPEKSSDQSRFPYRPSGG